MRSGRTLCSRSRSFDWWHTPRCVANQVVANDNFKACTGIGLNADAIGKDIILGDDIAGVPALHNHAIVRVIANLMFRVTEGLLLSKRARSVGYREAPPGTPYNKLSLTTAASLLVFTWYSSGPIAKDLTARNSQSIAIDALSRERPCSLHRACQFHRASRRPCVEFKRNIFVRGQTVIQPAAKSFERIIASGDRAHRGGLYAIRCRLNGVGYSATRHRCRYRRERYRRRPNHKH